MKAIIILFVFGICSLHLVAKTHMQSWIRCTPEESVELHEYEWRVSEERVRVYGEKVRKEDAVAVPTFSTDFSFAVKKGLLGMLETKFYALNDGWLVYVNAGEFGGGLSWYSEDGTQNYKIAKGFNIRGFLEVEDTIFVYGGLSHLGSSYGFIRKLKLSEDGKWELQKSEGASFASPVQLLRKPTAVYHLSGKKEGLIWVVCSRQIAEYYSSDDTFHYKYGHIGYRDAARSLWSAHSPNSITLDLNGIIYIGTEVGVLQVAGGQEVWLKPREAQQ